MTLNDFLSKAGDLFKANEAQGETVPKTEHEKAQARIVELQGEVAKLQSDLAASRAETEKAKAETNKAKVDAKAEVEKAKADAKVEIDAKEADVETRASAKAATITAAQGQPPLTNAPKENATANTPDKPKLFGLAKVQAAIREQLNSQK